MPNLKDLRVRISSVKSTQKITAAMKMVAAAKLRRAQEQAEASRPYAERMQRMLASLAAGASEREGAPKLLAGTGSDKVHLILVGTSDRGLCGGFNSNIVREARRMAEGSKPSPSIMAPIISENSKEQKILAKDIELMRSIYGENGFLPDSDVDDFSFYKAEMFIENDMFEEALSYVEKYIQSNQDEELLFYKGEAIWGLDRYSEAEKIIDEVLEINPENTDALYIKGKALTKSKNYDEAIETFDKVLEIDPKHDKALSYKGIVFSEQEMYEEAGKYFFESYDINRYNVSNLVRIGNWLADYEEAIKFYDFALRIEPDKRSALNNKGNALYNLERFEEAIEYFDKVLEMYPNNEQKD